jgi:hypothetical protein
VDPRTNNLTRNLVDSWECIDRDSVMWAVSTLRAMFKNASSAFIIEMPVEYLAIMDSIRKYITAVE